LIIDKRHQDLLNKLNLTALDLFKGKEVLLNEIVNRESKFILNLTIEKKEFENIYDQIDKLVNRIDSTLRQHVEALETRHVKALSALEKKMFRAEKRKFSDQKNQLNKIFSSLFPNDGLQERTENFMLFYSKWGNDFFKMLYDASLTLEEKFCIIETN
jgi:bacillithiol synthase